MRWLWQCCLLFLGLRRNGRVCKLGHVLRCELGDKAFQYPHSIAGLHGIVFKLANDGFMGRIGKAVKDI